MAQAASLFIDLNPEGNGSAYHVRNAADEVTRTHAVSRGKNLVVQADIVKVIHGRLRPDGDAATLIVTDFRFIPQKAHRRFSRAVITYSFAPSNTNSTDGGPDVCKIAPEGHYSMEPSLTHEEESRSAQLSTQTPSTVPVNAALTLAWNLTRTYDTKKYTTLTGEKRFEHRESGGKDAARWVLMENPSEKTGIPTNLRTAILLKRKSTDADQKFLATVDIKVDVDFVSTVEDLLDRVMGKAVIDDPVNFDPPLLAPPNFISREDNLDRENMEGLSAVTSTKLILPAAADGAGPSTAG